MKQLTSIITKKIDRIKNSFLYLTLFYTAVISATVLIFVLLAAKDVKFIYNQF